LDPGTAAGLAMLNLEVTRQAALLAYINDFWIMMAVTVLAIPLLMLIRAPKRTATAAAGGDVPH
ncbi:MAG: EmrB/QacA family drug resistance transporter, partial [Ramlibacter sp.]|nr:EmrB/QacA family drug resistance transporter [Ramlibacter sp.]